MEIFKLEGDEIENASKPTLSVGFVLTPKFTLLAFSGFIETLRHAADTGDRSKQILCKWQVLAADHSAVTSSCGVEIKPWNTFIDPKQFDYLIIVGGLIPRNMDYDPRLIEYILKAENAGVPIIGVCTGSFILAEAGLMNGVRTSVHWFHYEAYKENFPDSIPVSNEIFTIDRGRITCAGGSSTIDLALYLVEKHCGKGRALKCLKQMISDQARPSAHPQLPFFSGKVKCFEPRLRHAVFIMEQYIRDPISIDEIASKVNIGKKQLGRLFLNEFNIGPGRYYLELRLNNVCWLLLNTERSIAQIAFDCGFTDTSHLNKAFKNKYSIRAKEWRDSNKN